ncbi:MAG: anhydro-N-acetylmuramic acid kinase, partial [Acidobacteriota bacterium]|nr:anhydro-N-acetylmuramic acid kinase [Acidobacteriota bacterium]
AKSGTVHARLLEAMLSDPYFTMKPPKSTGRERFGSEFANGLIATGIALPDLIATATEFTARSIALAIPKRTQEVIASGGGVHNLQIMRRLGELLPGIYVKTTADFDVDPDAKEAIAFAVLAYEHARGRAGNLPRATGARRAVMLGKSSPG